MRGPPGCTESKPISLQIPSALSTLNPICLFTCLPLSLNCSNSRTDTVPFSTFRLHMERESGLTKALCSKAPSLRASLTSQSDRNMFQGHGPQKQLFSGCVEHVSNPLYHLLAPQSHPPLGTIVIWENFFKTGNQYLDADFKQYRALVCENGIILLGKTKPSFGSPDGGGRSCIYHGGRWGGCCLERMLDMCACVWREALGS